MPADSFVGIWKCIARPNLCEPPACVKPPPRYLQVAAFKNHIGLYAVPAGHSEFESELSKFKQGKGSVQFPLKELIPYGLIARIVKFKVEENNKTKISCDRK